ncbi:MAG: hypothetical protein U0269_18370 [Polyangiales bacterium]
MTAMQARRADGAVIDFSIKGSILRGLVLALKQDAKLAAVEAKLSGETLALVRALPTLGAWVDGIRAVELEEAMAEVLDARGLRELGRKSVAIELRGITRSMTEGILRLFGATPSVMFSRVSLFDPITVKGVKNTWTSTGPNSGQIRTQYATSKGLPSVMGEVSAGMLAATHELCGATGTVDFKGFTSDLRNEMLFDVKWD